MQRLIDAKETNKAIKKICDDYGIAYGNNYGGFADKIASVIDNMSTIDAEPVVRCKDCIYWQDRKVRMKNDEYRDYLPDEDMFVSIDKGINVGSHCTLHGYENMSGSWFWAQANDFCSRGEKKDKEKSRNDL